MELEEGKSGIQFLYNFAVILNVAPIVGEAKLLITGTDISVDEKGVAHPVLELRNDGLKHAYLSAMQLKLEMKDAAGKSIWKQTFTPATLSQSVGLGLVQPHATRRMVLPFELPQAEGVITASMRFEGRS